MVATIPLEEPKSFVKGATVKWRREFGDYPPATWTLSYAFVSDKDQRTVTATNNGDGTHLATISAADSAKFANTTYRYQAKVTDGSEVFVVVEGTITAIENFAAVKNHDARSHAEKTLEAIEAVIEDRATTDQSSMSLNGRSLSLMSVDELLTFRARYVSEVQQERIAERVASGLGSGQRILVRHGRAGGRGRGALS